MERHVTLVLTILNFCYCEWILIPSISLKKSPKADKNVNYDTACPDFHNLTAMTYLTEPTLNNSRSENWEISLDDIKKLINENKKIPQSSSKKYTFLNKIEERLQTETERRIKNLFNPGFREARFSSFHFPSMAGSLMTISMLLFGVHLTKLILKLLQSHYSKYNMPIRMMGGTRSPIMVPHNKMKRSVEMDIQKLHFINLIEKFNAQYK